MGPLNVIDTGVHPVNSHFHSFNRLFFPRYISEFKFTGVWKLSIWPFGFKKKKEEEKEKGWVDKSDPKMEEVKDTSETLWNLYSPSDFCFSRETSARTRPRANSIKKPRHGSALVWIRQTHTEPNSICIASTRHRVPPSALLISAAPATRVFRTGWGRHLV